MLVGVGDRRGTGRCLSQCLQAAVGEVGAVGIAPAAVAEAADADAVARGVGERLDSALVDPNLALDTLLGPGFGVGGTRRKRGLNSASGRLLETDVGHPAAAVTKVL